jgi:hypothetical protein
MCVTHPVVPAEQSPLSPDWFCHYNMNVFLIYLAQEKSPSKITFETGSISEADHTREGRLECCGSSVLLQPDNRANVLVIFWPLVSVEMSAEVWLDSEFAPNSEFMLISLQNHSENSQFLDGQQSQAKAQDHHQSGANQWLPHL